VRVEWGEGEAIACAQSGDAAAFESLYKAHASMKKDCNSEREDSFRRENAHEPS
jgi:hypothetical protein